MSCVSCCTQTDRLFQLPPRDRQFLRASHSRPEGDQRLPDGQRTELLAGRRGHLHNPITEQRKHQQTFTRWVLGPAQILFRGVIVSVGGIYFRCQSVDCYCCCWCCCLGGGGVSLYCETAVFGLFTSFFSFSFFLFSFLLCVFFWGEGDGLVAFFVMVNFNPVQLSKLLYLWTNFQLLLFSFSFSVAGRGRVALR